MSLVLSWMLLTGAAQLAPVPGRGSLAPEIAEAMRLRARLGVEEQASAATVYLSSRSHHHLVQDHTSVATRDASGGWTVVFAGETRAGLVRREPTAMPLETRRLSAAESRQLNWQLRSPSLYRQLSPRPRGGLSMDSYWHVMEIVTPQGRAVFRWNGRLGGVAGNVADLIIGRGDPE